MAKGVTNAPLLIWVYVGWYNRPEILALMAAGHKVLKVGLFGYQEEPDLIIHPAAGWSVELLEPEKREKDGSLYWPYLEAGLTRARARRRKK